MPGHGRRVHDGLRAARVTGPRAGALPSARERASALALGVFLALALGEGVVRVWWSDAVPSTGAPVPQVDWFGGRIPVRHDPLLGWVPRPLEVGELSPWPGTLTVDGRGLRSHGPQGAPVLLAVGDSFTFGDGVSDTQTWPAALQRRTGRTVLNAGVSGYGLDQIVLRTEALLATLDVDHVIAALIPDDVRRCAYAKRHAPKPYFVLENGGVELRGVPVPEEHLEGPPRLPRVLGQSRLADLVLRRIAPAWWRGGQGPVTDPARASLLAARLVERLVESCRAVDVSLTLVLLPSPTGRPQEAAPLLARARALGIPTLDLLRDFRRQAHADPAWLRMLPRHMTPEGNDWVAARIAQALQRHDAR